MCDSACAVQVLFVRVQVSEITDLGANIELPTLVPKNVPMAVIEYALPNALPHIVYFYP